MTGIRTDLCDCRENLEHLDRRLAVIEESVASRNAGHEIGRARSMTRAASEFVTRALGHHLDGSAEAPRP